MSTVVEDRIERLSTASARKVIEPDQDVPGEIGPGQIVADELLSTVGLDLDLSAEQKAILSREEIASITAAGIAFEAVLEAGFALEIATRLEPTDPRTMYLLHEIGEETRHQRIFIRLLEQLAPKAKDPLNTPLLKALMRRGVRRIITMPPLLYTLVLAGEEIPDLIQKRASEHPDTDPFIRAVNKYHRQEEARHLSFARAVLPEVWAKATLAQRFAVRRVAPLAIRGMFATLIHPGVYEAIGLPGMATWKAVNRSAPRVALRHEATRPVLAALIDAGALRAGRIPKGWRSLCGVDRAGRPLAPAAA